MRLFGLEISRVTKALNPVSLFNQGWRVISEPYAGAWQQNKSETHGTVLTYPTMFACVSRIAQDVAKLPILLKAIAGGIWATVDNPAYSPVLREPNNYQTTQQFLESWVLSKLLHGNTYVLKRRDNRGVVTDLYVLDPRRVIPMVADGGEVYYQLYTSTGAGVLQEGSYETVVVPASEVIHDRANTFHHQLIGVPPLCAANWAAVKNLKILKNSTEFFGNGARPGGILSAPAGLSDEDAAALKKYWDENFSGENSGKVAVIGADAKYQQLSDNAANSQLVEQMRYSDEQICQPFGIKPYKIGIGLPPSGWKADDINVEYYNDALSPVIEAIENLLDKGLSISSPLGIWLDTAPLWRMDEGKRAEVEAKLVGGKIETPDEARRKFDLPTTGGGDTLWGQHQDYPLGMLKNRTDLQPVPQPALSESDKTAIDQAKALIATHRAIEAMRRSAQEETINV